MHPTSRFASRLRTLASTVPVVALALLAPAPAAAHFELQAPACMYEQDSLGLPEKSPPCGQADPGTAAVATSMVSTFQEGQTITITINEVVFHPGHYRVSLAQDQSSLPAEPPVTAGATPCDSTTIEDPPVLPQVTDGGISGGVIADGLFVHTAPFSTPQTTQIQLPPGVTCTNCVLQVLEFMSDHPLNNPGGCFYHHCATVTIDTGDGGSVSTSSSSATTSGSSSAGVGGSVASTSASSSSTSTGAGGAGGSPAAASTSSSGGAGPASQPGANKGCSCDVPASTSATSTTLLGAVSLLAAALLARRRGRG